MTPRPEHITRDAVLARIVQVESIRAKWQGNPEYLQILDLDLWSLRVAFGDMDAENWIDCTTLGSDPR